MSMLKTCAINLCLAAGTAATAYGQIYKLHNADAGVAATGQFITTLTSNGNAIQQTTGTPGFVATLREHPVAWAGIEFNYGFSRYSQEFSYLVAGTTSLATLREQNSVHEFTAAYLFHPHFRHLQPFLGIGGGYQLFNPNTGQNQWRETGLLEAGLDIQPRTRTSVSVYRDALSSTARPTSTTQPSLREAGWSTRNPPPASGHASKGRNENGPESIGLALFYTKRVW